MWGPSGCGELDYWAMEYCNSWKCLTSARITSTVHVCIDMVLIFFFSVFWGELLLESYSLVTPSPFFSTYYFPYQFPHPLNFIIFFFKSYFTLQFSFTGTIFSSKFQLHSVLMKGPGPEDCTPVIWSAWSIWFGPKDWVWLIDEGFHLLQGIQAIDEIPSCLRR